jgi:hypothetical protein
LGYKKGDEGVQSILLLSNSLGYLIHNPESRIGNLALKFRCSGKSSDKKSLTPIFRGENTDPRITCLLSTITVEQYRLAGAPSGRKIIYAAHKS